MCQTSDSLYFSSWHGHTHGSRGVREEPVYPGGGALSRQVTGTCPSSVKVHLGGPGQGRREGGGWPGDSHPGKCALSPHMKQAMGPQGPVLFLVLLPLPPTNTYTVRMDPQPSTLWGHNIRSEVSVIDHQLPQHREVTGDQRGEVACCHSHT